MTVASMTDVFTANALKDHRCVYSAEALSVSWASGWRAPPQVDLASPRTSDRDPHTFCGQKALHRVIKSYMSLITGRANASEHMKFNASLCAHAIAHNQATIKLCTNFGDPCRSSRPLASDVLEDQTQSGGVKSCFCKHTQTKHHKTNKQKQTLPN